MKRKERGEANSREALWKERVDRERERKRKIEPTLYIGHGRVQHSVENSNGNNLSNFIFTGRFRPRTDDAAGEARGTKG